MKHVRTFVLSIAVVASFALGQGTKAPSQQATIASALDAEISSYEKQMMALVEAMPKDKFDFSPENLKIPGANFKGVRSFGLLVKHTAASNYAIWAPLTGDLFPKDYMGGDGPANLKTKAEIMKFLKDSFALGHKAAAAFTNGNLLQLDTGNRSIRLHRAMFAITHGFDGYGQMVEYLRMNGIVPPGSRE